MKRPKKTKSFVKIILTAVLSGVILVVFQWLFIFYDCAKNGSRNVILQIFPDALIYQSHSTEFLPGGLRQLLMPEGYLVPGVRARIEIRGEGKSISFKDIRLLYDYVDEIHVENCMVSDWENLINNPPLRTRIFIQNSVFIGGDADSQLKLNEFRRKDAETGKAYYFIGDV